MTTLMKRSGEPNVFAPLPTLQSFFNDPLLKSWFSWDTDNTVENSTLPAVNISETENSYEISVAAPGMSKNDFKVQFEHNLLRISGEKKQGKEEREANNWLRREFNYLSFTRSFTLSEKQVNTEDIRAKYVDGVLHVSLPKSADAKTKPTKVIQIS
jgi:HSP20 family protein